MKTRTFIPIECDINNDNRINALINHAGVAGYGTYMILLIELRNMKDYCMDGETLKMISRKYNIRRKLLENVLYNYNLFTVEFMPDGNMLITSEYVTRVMQNYEDKIAQCSIAGKKSADKRKVAADERPLNSVATTEQNTTEQNRKEEEEEKQEKEETPPPPLPPVIPGVKPVGKSGVVTPVRNPGQTPPPPNMNGVGTEVKPKWI